MSETTAAVQTSTLGLHSLEQYEPFVGTAVIERILKKAEPLRTLHLVHISSTFYGGGVTEILTPLTLTLNAMGIETGWWGHTPATRNGENGFLVESVDQAAERIVQIIKDPRLRQRLGARARETVRENYLMSRLVEDWIDVLSAFQGRLPP